MPDPSISDDDLLRVTRSFLDRIDQQQPPRDIEGEVMRAIAIPHGRRWVPATRLLASGLLIAAVAAAGCVALVLHLQRPTPVTASPVWAIVAGPTSPATPYGQLAAITCPNAGDCWAVGDLEKGTHDAALIERYQDGGWSMVATPAPSGASGSGLAGITCVSADDCWAVGSYTEADGMDQGLVEQYAGGAWSIVPSPTPSGGAALTGVACADAGECWAVGGAVSAGTSGGLPLVEAYAGSGWAVVPSPTLPAGSGSLSGVTCVTGGGCWAVGATDQPLQQATLIEHESGGVWTIVSSPNPSGASTNSLNLDGGALDTVACVDADDCWAVGSPSGSFESAAGPLIEQYRGAGWQIVSAPAPTGGPGTLRALDGVSCNPSGDCWAVGFYTSASISAGASLDGGRRSLVEQNAGAGWRVVSSADAPGGSSTLMGVACTSAGDCWAVGYDGTPYLATAQGTLKNGTLIEWDSRPAG